ncbi:hypothetical protein SteCoe_23002 [Stentor coeruleus]|uniref:Uncharacterized protein n=1 Tax=Stentor coeruleus TaxID=5963 RepID=A0A1R2BL20_9CILI|nr:hypothetical protein SteCoe_23002 [Stentor coeruleus]
MEERESKIKYISTMLEKYGAKIPNLCSESMLIDEVYESFCGCFDTISKEQRAKSEFNEAFQRYQVNTKELLSKLEEYEDQFQNQQSEISRLQNVLTQSSLKAQKEREKLMQERDQARIEADKSDSSRNHLVHELKKRELEKNKLIDTIQKIRGENNLPIKNPIEATSKLVKQGIGLGSLKGEEEYVRFVKKGYESTLKYYTEIIQMMQKALESAFDVIKGFLMKIKVDVRWNELEYCNFEKFNAEVEFRLKNFEVSVKDIEKPVDDDEEFPRYTMPYMKKLLEDYKVALDSKVFMLCNLNST